MKTKIKTITLTFKQEDYDKLFNDVIKSKTMRIVNGKPIYCVTKYIKQKLGIEYV